MEKDSYRDYCYENLGKIGESKSKTYTSNYNYKTYTHTDEYVANQKECTIYRYRKTTVINEDSSLDKTLVGKCRDGFSYQ